MNRTEGLYTFFAIVMRIAHNRSYNTKKECKRWSFSLSLKFKPNKKILKKDLQILCFMQYTMHRLLVWYVYMMQVNKIV